MSANAYESSDPTEPTPGRGALEEGPLLGLRVAALVFVPAAVAVFLTSVHSLFLRLAPPDLGLGRIGAPASFRRIISCLTVAWSCSQNVFECSAPVSLRSMKFLTQRSANSTHALANERLVASYSVRARSRSGRMSVLHATATPAKKSKARRSERRTWR